MTTSKDPRTDGRASAPAAATDDVVTVQRGALDAILTRQRELEAQLAQLRTIDSRAREARKEDLQSAGSISTEISLYGLHTGCRYRCVDDGYDVLNGQILPHAGRARIVEMLERRKVVDGREHPVFVLADPVAPRYQGDPIARAPVYSTDNASIAVAEEALSGAKRKLDALVQSRARQERASTIERIRAALVVAGEAGSA
jgi:hypothetical protein